MKDSVQTGSQKAQSNSDQSDMLVGDNGPVRTDGAAAFSLRKTAHDLRNALNVMRNAGYLLRRKLVAAGGEHVDLVDMIEDSVKSAEAIATAIMDHAIASGEPPTSGGSPRAQ